jgi:hypothetical protein
LCSKLTGRAHCVLGDLTHGTTRPRSEWTAQCDALPVALECVHLNERTQALFDASEGCTPCVLAEVEDGHLEMVMDTTVIRSCEGDVSTFQRMLQYALFVHSLRY